MSYRISEVARMAGVTVRTLHHYDEIGLVSPSARTDTGYRIYERADLERLQEVLVLRELELPLEAIREITSGGGSRTTVLHGQLRELIKRRDRLNTIIATVELTLLDTGDEMSDNDLFGGFDPSEYEDEAKERWGETEAHKESTRRTRQYTQDDWKRQAAELDDTEGALAALLVTGVSADSAQAMDVAERLRLHIDTWFYPCSHEMHASLAEMYVTDPRFTAHYEDRQSGLARYVRDAIVANRERGLGNGTENGTGTWVPEERNP